MKKKHIITLSIVGIIAVVIIIAILALTSSKDLGVRYTKADLDSVNKKLGIDYGTLAQGSGNSLEATGTKSLDQQLTQSELTALLNQPSKQWKDYPVKDVQMRINADGTVEMTGKILANRFNAYSEATDMPDRYKNMIADKAGLVPVNPSFYYKGNYQVKDNKLEGDMTELKIGPLEVPKDWTDNNKDFINGFVEDRLNSAGLDVQSATFADGKLDIKGSTPQSIDFES